MNNSYYNHYGIGDYVLAQTKDQKFLVHARTGKWKRVSVNTAFAVRINKEKTFEYNVETNQFYLNQKPVTLKVGQSLKLAEGSEVKRTKNNAVTVSSSNSAQLIAEWNRSPCK